VVYLYHLGGAVGVSVGSERVEPWTHAAEAECLLVVYGMHGICLSQNTADAIAWPMHGRPLLC
jgi:hypothetical protein